MIKIKICGVTNEQDALWAANLGADFVGLNFYSKSPRKVSTKKAKEIVSKLPPFVGAVGVFVDEPAESVAKIARSTGLQTVQLHGNETPEACRTLKNAGLKVIKCFRLQGPLDIATLAPYEDVVDFYLFDFFMPDVVGGTGQLIDSEWLKPAASLAKPWFLAGGLKPDNVAERVSASGSKMVDVCSGVERSPKHKDYDAMKVLIQNARSLR